MGRHKKQLTQEQIDWRNSILRGKVDKVKIEVKPPEFALTEDDKLRQCFYYMNNCVYWVNRYIDGDLDKKRLLETVKAIQVNAKNLETILNTGNK